MWKLIILLYLQIVLILTKNLTNNIDNNIVKIEDDPSPINYELPILEISRDLPNSINNTVLTRNGGNLKRSENVDNDGNNGNANEGNLNLPISRSARLISTNTNTIQGAKRVSTQSTLFLDPQNFPTAQNRENQENQGNQRKSKKIANLTNAEDNDTEIIEADPIINIENNNSAEIVENFVENSEEILEEEIIPQINIENIQTNTENIKNIKNIKNNSPIFGVGNGYVDTKYIGPFGNLFVPIKDKFQRWTAYLTHPNVGLGLGSFIKKPVILLQKLHEKGANFLHGANGVIFGSDEFTDSDYPYPYRSIVTVGKDVNGDKSE